MGLPTYEEIQPLLGQNGWKQLWYLTKTELMESCLRERVNQPAAWDNEMKERDGIDSGAECKMYVGREDALSEYANSERTPTIAFTSFPYNAIAFSNPADRVEKGVVAKLVGWSPPLSLLDSTSIVS